MAKSPRHWVNLLLRSFRRKYLLALLPVALIPLLVSLVLVLNQTNDHLQSQQQATLRASGERMMADLNNRLEQIALIDDTLAGYITTHILRSGFPKVQNYAELTRFENMCDNISNIQTVYEIQRVRIYADKLPFSELGNHVNFFSLSAAQALIADSGITTGKGFGALRYQMSYDQNINGRRYDLVTFMHGLYDLNQQLSAVFCIDLDVAQLLSIIANEPIQAQVYVADAQGLTVCSTDGALQYEQFMEQVPQEADEYIRDGQLILRYPLRLAPWTLTVVQPISPFSGMENQLTRLYILIIVFACLLSLMVSSLLSRMFTKRLTSFYNAVKSLPLAASTDDDELPDRLVRLAQSGRSKDEIDGIMLSFSCLIRNNLRLVAQHKQHEVDIAHYQFQVLQEQINPHFLYNALETLRLSMVLERMQGAIGVLDSLSRFYRIALSKGRDTITLSEEISMIGCYLEIENVGYEGRIHWHIDLNPLLGDMPIPKFLIQPLIENSIVHGVCATEGQSIDLEIRIDLEEDQVVICVRDNGKGMDEQALNQLRQALKEQSATRTSSGYGLRNVDHRIKLFYGNAYGLQIQSDANGTTNIMRLPFDIE